MKKIAIIGAGQLGSRHLQGIAQSSIDISIEVVEPFEKARKTAVERYNEVDNKNKVKEIKFYDSINSLSSNIDMAIIATSSDVRAKVIDELLKSKKVKNLILEKVLFQSIKEYADIEDLLKKTDTKCWVNHPRRMFPVYKKLKEKLKNAKQISYNFQGGDWGLACNGLHFIDHFAYLVNSTNLSIDNKFLDNTIYDSKRRGFIEFNGLLTGKIDNNPFSLYSNTQETPSVFTILSDVLIAIIKEDLGEIKISTKESGWKSETIKEKIIYFQSELSNILIEDIFINKKCYLPTYKEAVDLHIPYIRCLLDHMKNITGQEHDICPIT